MTNTTDIDVYNELKNNLAELAEIGADRESGLTRLAFSNEEKEAKEYIVSLFKKEGLAVRYDHSGNIIARREGTCPNAPAVAVGSHIDTVVNAGMFDGSVGVLAGLQVIRRLNQEGITTEHPIEVISFSCEESSRFGVSTIGSKAMAGKVNSSRLAGLKDNQGMSFSEALSKQGMSLDKIHLAARQPRELKAFLEVHIEQGPVLESHGNVIGIVTDIAAPTRYGVKINGKAGHSGTTVMDLRKDALTAAAEIILFVEETAKQDTELVGTVGVLNSYPGTANTIPAKTEFIIEFRSADQEVKQKAKNKLYRKIKELEKKRKVTVTTNLLSDERPVPLAAELTAHIENVCRENDYSFRIMSSGAGHDAMNLASLCPAGLIFIPSVGGISHHPDEFTKYEDILAGSDVLYKTVLKLVQKEVSL